MNSKLFHHTLSPQYGGFECKKCSAYALDINQLKAVPCIRGELSSMSGDDAKRMIEHQSQKLQQMKKILELQELEKNLAALVAKRDAAAPAAPAAPPTTIAPAATPAAPAAVCHNLSSTNSMCDRLKTCSYMFTFSYLVLLGVLPLHSVVIRHGYYGYIANVPCRGDSSREGEGPNFSGLMRHV